MEYSKETHWKINKKWVKRFLLLGILFAVISALILPMYYGNNTDRSKAAEILSYMSQAKTEVTEFIYNNPPGTPVNVKFDIPHDLITGTTTIFNKPILIEYANIAESGVITVLVSGLGIYLELTPEKTDNLIIWTCYGRPIRLVPSSCRTEKTRN